LPQTWQGSATLS